MNYGQMPRQKPIPTVQAGGMQPYQGSTPQVPGMALTAMLAGRTLQGHNPQDLPRQTRRAARNGGGHLSLLASLLR